MNSDNWIMTRTGKKFFPCNPRIEDVDVEDIAHALSHICRFGGHSSRFYSVAEHSIVASVLCPDEFKLKGLLHDAAEAYLGDVPSPMKTGSQADTERVLLNMIFKRFGVASGGDDVVKRVDKKILF